MAPRWLRALPLLALAMGLSQAVPARALVPYAYVPRPAELEGAGLGIAQAASRLLRLGQAEDAARLAALTVRLLPEDPRSWVLLAEAELRSNQLKEAATSLARAKQLDPRNPGIWFAEGALALRDNRPQEAIDLLEEGLRLDGKNASAFFDLGNARILLHQPAPALAAFERAAQLRRDFWEAINNQALVLFEQGDTKAAISRWRRVLTIRPDAAEPNLALAAALYQLQGPRDPEALTLADQALNAEPNYVLDEYQSTQLWGPKLRAASQRLFREPRLRTAVERAHANANPDGDSGEEEEF